MGWVSDFKRDLGRYTGEGGLDPVKQLLAEQGLWALLQYRVEAAVYRSTWPGVVKIPLRLLLTISHKVVEILTGINLPCTARIGPGLHLPHCGTRVLHAETVIGADCCISQGATIGVSGRGERRGVPVLGDRVYVGVNAVVAGKISVGDDTVIGANSLVTQDVPVRCTVVGVPAQIINRKGSSDYIVRPQSQLVATGTQALRLLIVARVPHFFSKGQFYSYTPYAREIDIWADLFSEVTVAGTLRFEEPPPDCTAFTRPNVKVVPVAEAGGDGVAAKLKQLFVLPRIIYQVHRYMLNADAISARCPCDLGLLGVIMGPLYSRRLIAKYATQWLPYKGEPLGWRLQRWLLSSPWWRGVVTVYGKWPNQPEKVIPFFTSMLTREQISRAQTAVRRSRKTTLLRVLFVGRLSTSKNVDILLQAFAGLRPKTAKLQCVIVGEGPQRGELEWQTKQLGIDRQVVFTGGLDFDEVLGWYEKSNVLVLASGVEGWPKAIAEAMAFGLVCVGTERGMMPQMLGEGRGLLVPPRDVPALTRALQWIIEHPEQAALMSRRSAEWAQCYSLEGLKEALRDLMNQSWASLEQSPGIRASVHEKLPSSAKAAAAFSK